MEDKKRRRVTTMSFADQTLIQLDYLKEQIGTGSRSSVAAIAIRDMHDKYVDMNHSRLR
jgi:hypothetical protein